MSTKHLHSLIELVAQQVLARDNTLDTVEPMNIEPHWRHLHTALAGRGNLRCPSVAHHQPVDNRQVPQAEGAQQDICALCRKALIHCDRTGVDVPGEQQIAKCTTACDQLLACAVPKQPAANIADTRYSRPEVQAAVARGLTVIRMVVIAVCLQ